ncbi:MAG: FliA/WhiG family RNA polymerase sigma factor [Clostridiales bacterium]|jgi:RNA polymerase sigma factor for flagellar operon FliA|nr:FliA/WhiG family RNA polymerase sigma factor [Clostridiales bacterium]
MKNTETRSAAVAQLWEQYLADRDVSVRNSLVVEYGYLVKCIALKTVGRYQHFNSMEDIVNEGLIALLDAVEKFDPDKQVKFETFASIKIRGAMIDFIRRQDCFPRRLKRMAKDLSDAENLLSHRLGRSPTDKELADFLNVSLVEYEKMQAETCALNMLSFEEMIYEKGVENIESSLTSEQIQGPEQFVSEKELRDVLAQNVDLLNDNEKIVISLYYREQLKIKEISGVMGISDSRVSQIHSNALRKLKKSLSEYYNL